MAKYERWTKEKVMEISKQFKTIYQFQLKYSGAYDIARKNNWLDDFYNKYNKR